MLQSQIQLPQCDGEASSESSGLAVTAWFFLEVVDVVMNVDGGHQTSGRDNAIMAYTYY